MRASITIASIAVALLCAGSAVRAQRVPAPARPGWLSPLTNYEKTITASQLATFEARFEKIERLLLQVPELSYPVRFEVQPQFEAYPAPNGELISSKYFLRFFLPRKADQLKE